MSNRNDNHDDKPWEKKFEDGKDENGLYSRRASKRKDKLNSRLPALLLLGFCFVIAATIALYFISLKTAAQPTNDDGGNIEVVTSSSSKKTSGKSSARKDKKSSSVKKEAESSNSQAENSSQSESSSEAESSSAEESSSSAEEASSSSQSEGAQYVTVAAGQGLYRIAVNNGLTVDQLVQLNPGLTPSSTVTPGQQLRVK
ncbi:SAG1386/EF1546 family surface-associated protein [Ligilactobacillus sp.]|uniref:SAG1386/EF1546 family surface-associated protein n=1 Tax=Ligilactobacillus sp. TaxID=2767921 RepID=UPI002FE3DC4A